MAFPPLLLKHPRAPFTKPAPGLGINWAHPHSKYLVHSYPFNEGKGEICKNYCWPRGEYDLKFRVPNVATSPQWGVFAKVPGLRLDIGDGQPLIHVNNTGTTNADTTGLRRLPCIDFSKGFTAHVWMRPTESLVGVVTAYNLVMLGPLAQGVNLVFHIHLTRFAASGTDWWRRNIVVYSNGVASTTLTNSDEVWLADFPAGRVKIDSLPYEHVISVTPNSPTPEVRWYSSDGYNFGFAGAGAITPPDGNQWWPHVGDAGSVFEGNLWAINIYNRPMGFKSAMSLMANPLGMYKVRSSGGALIGEIPPLILPPASGSGGSDADDDVLTKLQICTDTI
jgi:hypothetical protein